MAMKTIRVFISASNDLSEVRTAVQDLLAQLNRYFVPRGVEFVSTLPSEGPTDGDLALALYWKDFGSLTQTNFEKAYDSFKASKAPKIYVFFKDPDSGITDALKAFRDSFAAKYGHFYCHFEHVDSVKFQMAVQTLEMLPGEAAANPLKVENSEIALGEERIASLDNLPFAKLNARRQSLLRQISSAEREVAELEEQGRESPDDETLSEALRSARVLRQKLKDELKEHEGFLFDSAVFFAKASAEWMDERVRKAYELFERGKIQAANKILDLEELVRQDDRDRQLYDEVLETRRAAMREFAEKGQMVLADESLPLEVRHSQAQKSFENAIRIGREIGCAEKELSAIQGRLEAFR